jgi:hypothetical protein
VFKHLVSTAFLNALWSHVLRYVPFSFYFSFALAEKRRNFSRVGHSGAKNDHKIQQRRVRKKGCAYLGVVTPSGHCAYQAW